VESDLGAIQNPSRTKDTPFRISAQLAQIGGREALGTENTTIGEIGIKRITTILIKIIKGNGIEGTTAATFGGTGSTRSVTRAKAR